ncbi:unnamed protein product [Calypogeia fissa]
MATQVISGALLKGFLTSTASILIPVALGGALGAKEIFRLAHVDGMMKYIFWVGLPALVFRRLALSDPGTLDVRLLGSDALSKLIPFALLLLWRRFFSKSGRIESFEWVITFFMLSTLPNTVFIGDAVLNPLFGVQIERETTSIIFAQSLYWYNLCIILLEIREVMLEDEKAKTVLPTVVAMDKLPGRKLPPLNMQKGKEVLEPSLSTTPGEMSGRVTGETEDDTQSKGSTRAFSCSSRSFTYYSPVDSLAQSFSSAVCKLVPDDQDKAGSVSGRVASDLHVDQALGTDLPTPRIALPLPKPPANLSKGKQQTVQMRDFENDKGLRQVELEFGRNFGMDGFRPLSEFSPDPAQKMCSMLRASWKAWFTTKASFSRMLVTRIVLRIFSTPLVYASIFGFVYSLLAVKHNWRMPSFILTTFSFLADGAIGLAMVALGVILASSILASKSLWGMIPCGMKWLLAGFAARYFAAPIFMYASSAAFSLKGTTLRYAIVQVLIPQASFGFALAKQYNCKMTIMLAATMVQMLSFIPIVLAFYAFLDAV